MDNKLKKFILDILHERQAEVELYEIITDLGKCYLIDSKDYKAISLLKEKANHMLIVLQSDGLVQGRNEEYNNGQLTFRLSYYSLTAKGYEEFNAWYKKLWLWFNNDFAKLLSVIAIILSIIATIISLWKK